MRKVRVYDVISKHRQIRLVGEKLRQAHTGHSLEFVMPNNGEMERHLHLVPLRSYKYDGWFHQFITGGEQDDFGAVAIVELANGTIEETSPDCIQFIHTHNNDKTNAEL